MSSNHWDLHWWPLLSSHKPSIDIWYSKSERGTVQAYFQKSSRNDFAFDKSKLYVSFPASILYWGLLMSFITGTVYKITDCLPDNLFLENKLFNTIEWFSRRIDISINKIVFISNKVLHYVLNFSYFKLNWSHIQKYSYNNN